MTVAVTSGGSGVATGVVGSLVLDVPSSAYTAAPPMPINSVVNITWPTRRAPER
ncbi:hypothetical protein [Arthrobacter woluwensis]|uniref:hypothetical protein n=1 Tax=Arthrobacter woluwensis TaxID=156980 RepID=UPI003816C50B